MNSKIQSVWDRDPKSALATMLAAIDRDSANGYINSHESAKLKKLAKRLYDRAVERRMRALVSG